MDAGVGLSPQCMLQRLQACGAMLAQGLSRRIHCLAVHPSRPHLCVTGASSGTLAVWDLRMTSAPAVHSTSRPGSGDVLEVILHLLHHDFSGAEDGRYAFTMRASTRPPQEVLKSGCAFLQEPQRSRALSIVASE